MDRVETLEYLKKKYSKGDRIVVPRYNDGEYLLMNNLKGHVAQSFTDFIGKLLERSIKTPNQFVCINHLKPHNIQKKDTWYKTQQYFLKITDHQLYGCGNWSNYDFCNKNELLPQFFKGKTLLVAGLADEAETFFAKTQPEMDFYKTPTKDCANHYVYILEHLENVCNDYENILFSCGPLSKVLIADLADSCKCNLIDLGAVLNAILKLTDRWPMSWVKEINLDKQVKEFCERIK